MLIIAVCALAILVLPLRWLLVWGAPLAAILTPIMADQFNGTVISPLNVLVLVALIRLLGDPGRGKQGRLRVPEVLILCTLGCSMLLTLLVFGSREGTSNSLSTVLVTLIGAIVVYLMAIPRYGLEPRDIFLPWVAAAVLTTVVQHIEVLTGQWLIPENSAFFHSPYRDGEMRAQGLFPHPIVAGMICVASAAWLLLTPGIRIPLRLFGVALLFAGAWSTQSRGPLAAVAAGIVMAVVVRWVGRKPTSRRAVLGMLVAGGILAVVVFVVSNSTTYIAGLDEAETSANYRLALVTSGLSAIAENPWGFGAGRIPTGVLLVDSVYGPLDLSQSVDNGYLLVALEHGLPTTVLLVGFVWNVCSGRQRPGTSNSAVLAVLFTLLVGGVSVAMTSWVPYTFFLAQVVAVVGAKKGTDETGVSRRSRGSRNARGSKRRPVERWRWTMETTASNGRALEIADRG